MRNTEKNLERFSQDTRLRGRGWGNAKQPGCLFKERPRSMKESWTCFHGWTLRSQILYFKNLPRSSPSFRTLLRGYKQSSGLCIPPMIISTSSVLCLNKNTFVKIYTDSWKPRKPFLGKCQPGEQFLGRIIAVLPPVYDTKQQEKSKA